ncbi:MAG: class I SAM-dependent methyltransferase [Thermodesulfobacteriota bacterium]
MEEKERRHSESLKEFILSQIEKNGPIPFVQFMQWCLYHEDYGYYQSHRPKIGREGDYYTGPCVHPIYGVMIAKQLSQMAEILGEKNFEIAEMGSGRGFLCEDILTWAKRNNPRFYSLLIYHLIEKSSYHLKEQHQRLSEFTKEGKVFWIRPEIFEQGDHSLTGCFLSNELVDSFPVHRMVQIGGELKEIYVTQVNGEFQEVIGPPSHPELLNYFKFIGIDIKEGQLAEINLQALQWIETVSRCLKKGFVLTIDYGYLAEELYAPTRLHGTLLCYYRHQALENPYQRLGEQDITSHVNFTALIKKGEEVGLRFTGLVPQYQFLLALGVLQELELLSQDMNELEKLKLRLSLMHLIEPEVGMGEVFKVLIQHKGIDPPLLDGLRNLGSISWPVQPNGEGS